MQSKPNCQLSKGGQETHDIYYCNCHNETKHQINVIIALLMSSIYHSLSQCLPMSACLQGHKCGIVNMVVAGTERNYTIRWGVTSTTVEREWEGKRNACQVIGDRMMINLRLLSGDR